MRTPQQVITLTSRPQVLSFHAAAKAQGEVFDVTCFGGCAQYHALRTQGKVGPGMLSSIHIRCTDFEAQAHTEEKEGHAASTHKLHMPCMAIWQPHISHGCATPTMRGSRLTVHATCRARAQTCMR